LFSTTLQHLFIQAKTYRLHKVKPLLSKLKSTQLSVNLAKNVKSTQNRLLTTRLVTFAHARQKHCLHQLKRSGRFVTHWRLFTKTSKYKWFAPNFARARQKKPFSSR